MLIVSTWTPKTITIDGEEVELRIKRMSVEEHIEFTGKARANAEPTFFRFVSRSSDADEQEVDEDGNYKLTLAQLFDRRYSAMKAEERQAFSAAVAEDEIKAQEFLKYVFGSFVKVARGLVEKLEDGTEKSILEGLDFLRLFGARNDVLSEVVTIVRNTNELSPKKKEISKSDSGSIVSSSELAPDPDGPKPVTTAPSVAIVGSVLIEDATAPTWPETEPATEPATEPSET